MDHSDRVYDQAGGDLDSIAFDTSHHGGVRDSEEMIAELRRENFRLRLLCYNYEKVFSRSNNPQEADSSRLFAAETKNMTLQDALAEKDALLSYVSKYLDELKRENSLYEAQIKDLMNKMESQEIEWRDKYEAIYSELEKVKSVSDGQEVDRFDRPKESFRFENEYQNRILELEGTIQSLHADLDNEDKQAEIFQNELNNFRLLLQQFNKELNGSNELGFPVDSVNVEVLDAFKLRIEDLNVAAKSVLCMIPATGVKAIGDNALDCYPTHKLSSPEPLTELTEQAKSSVERVSTLASPNVQQEIAAEKCSTESVTYLTEDNYKQLVKRLNAARRLIFDLGSEKLKQDKLIENLQASLESRNRELNKNNIETQTVNCLQESKSNMNGSEVQLMPSGLLNVVMVPPSQVPPTVPLDPSDWSEISEASNADQANTGRPVSVNQSRCSPLLASLQKATDPSDSLAPLRSLHQLVLSLRRHLDTVQFTQHSFVEMINRSLSTAGIDASFQLSQNLLNLQTDSPRKVPNQVSFLEKSTNSRAYATYGGIDTLFDNFDESIAHSNQDQLPPAINSSMAALNLTVAELRSGFPASPAPAKDHPSVGGQTDSEARAAVPELPRRPRSRLPVLKKCLGEHSSAQQSSSVKLNFSLVSNDHEEDGVSANNQSCPGSMLAGNTSLHTCLVPSRGDVTVMEWEHRDLFERILSAMSRLRDAIQDCSDASTELWSGDANNCLSFLLSGVAHAPMNTIDSVQPTLEQHVSDAHPVSGDHEASDVPLCEDRQGTPASSAIVDRTPATNLKNISTGCESPSITLLPKRMSARFDNASQNENVSGDDISLSQLYGSVWRGGKSICQSQTRPEVVEEDDYQQTLVLLQANDPADDNAPVLSLQDRVKSLFNRLTDSEDRYAHCLEECRRLQALQQQSVPMGDYNKLREELQHLTSDMACTQQAANQQAILTTCLQEFNFPVDQRPLLDCVNDLLSEVTDLRSLRQEQRQWEESSDRLQQQLTDQDKQLRQSQASLLVLEKLVDDAIKTLVEVVSTDSEPGAPIGLMDLVRSAVEELTTRRSELDALVEDYELARSTFANLLDCSLPDNAGEFAQALETKVTGFLQELTYYQGEVEQSLDAIQNTSVVLPADCVNLTSHVSVLLECLLDRERELTSAHLQCSDVRDALTEAVATISERDSEVLQLKDSLECLRISSVASDVYQTAADRLAVLEQQTHDALTLLSTMFDFTNTADESLVGRLDVLRVEFGHLRQYTTRIESDYNSAVVRCKSLEEQVNGTLVESEKVKSDLTLQLQQAKSLGEQLLVERDSLAAQLSHKEAELTSKAALNSKEISSLQGSLYSVTKQLEVSEEEIVRVRQELVVSAARVSLGDVSTQTVTPTVQHTGCLAEFPLEPAAISESTITPLPHDHLKLSEGHPEQDRVCETPASQVTPDESNNSLRMRKYQELKTVAFELKDKLVSRTDKLEVALKEVARLRNVIQQDKERASRVLDEVEELRNQVLLKNQKIQILESALRRVKALPSIERSPHSSARAASEREQPRHATIGPSSLTQPIEDVHANATVAAAGTSIWPSVSENHVQYGTGHQNSVTSNGAHGYAPTSLLFDCPITPDIAACSVTSAEQQNATMHLLDSSSLIFSSGDTAAPSENQPDSKQYENHSQIWSMEVPSTCKQCRKLSGLVVSLRRLLDDLRNGVRVDLVEEWSLLSALEGLDQQHKENSPTQTKGPSASDKPPAVKLIERNSQIDRSLLSTSSDSLPLGVKENIKCLNHARVQLRHYAREMDHFCNELLVSCRQPFVGKTDRPQSTDTYRVVVKRTVHLLKGVLKKLHAFFPETEVSRCEVVTEIFCDLKTVLTILCSAGPTGSENKENIEEDDRKVEKNRKGSNHTCQCSVTKNLYEQRYYNLVHNVDKMLKDLSHTSEVLVDARNNLEQSGVRSPPIRHSSAREACGSTTPYVD